MQTTSAARITEPMRRSLQERLAGLDKRISALTDDWSGADSVEVTALLMQLESERSDIVVALQDALMIDDEPFDTQAIEIGDTFTISDSFGNPHRYVLVDGKVRSRARSDWVSVSSPLGTAILGRSKGDRVRVDSPDGPVFYVVLDFERTSDDPLTLRTLAGKDKGLGSYR
jgi:transcription elongation factor GreA